MAFEDIKAEIALLMSEMIEQPEDLREVLQQLREKLSEMRAMGMTPPADLVDLERRLQTEVELPSDEAEA